MAERTANLQPDALYRIKWASHYNREQVDPGYLGRFLNWQPRFDSLHGDLMHQEALFRRVKSSGRESYMFGVSLAEAEITEVGWAHA